MLERLWSLYGCLLAVNAWWATEVKSGTYSEIPSGLPKESAIQLWRMTSLTLVSVGCAHKIHIIILSIVSHKNLIYITTWYYYTYHEEKNQVVCREHLHHCSQTDHCRFYPKFHWCRLLLSQNKHICDHQLTEHLHWHTVLKHEQLHWQLCM